MSNIAPAKYWAVVSPMIITRKRRYIDLGSISYTRRGAVEKHCDRGVDWSRQRKRGWTVDRVIITALAEQGERS